MNRAKGSQHRDRCYVAMSDEHTGHLVGLTPPSFHWDCGNETLKQRALAIQRECYSFYRATINALKPIDAVMNVGDAIDGDGNRSGGAELIIPDRLDQAKVSADLLAECESPRYVLVRGTAYHTGQREEFENTMVEKLEKSGAKVSIGDHEWPQVEGTDVVFDLKHKIGSSRIPHGRYTPLALDMLWNELWAVQEEQPKASIIIRGHVHYHVYLGGADWPLVMTLPALQGMGTRYGKKECTGRVHFGLVSFHITRQGAWTWQAHIGKFASQKAQTCKI